MSTEDLTTIHSMGTNGGSFVRALAKAALLADPVNLDIIKKSWPDIWLFYSAIAQAEGQEKQHPT